MTGCNWYIIKVISTVITFSEDSGGIQTFISRGANHWAKELILISFSLLIVPCIKRMLERERERENPSYHSLKNGTVTQVTSFGKSFFWNVRYSDMPGVTQTSCSFGSRKSLSSKDPELIASESPTRSHKCITGWILLNYL